LEKKAKSNRKNNKDDNQKIRVGTKRVGKECGKRAGGGYYTPSEV